MSAHAPEVIKEGLTDADAVPEQVETRCKPGDLWTLGNHRLLCGDSTNVQHVERLMGGEKADMVFTDPPYGMNLDTDFDKLFQSDSSHVKKGNRFGKVIGDDADYDPSPILYFQCQLFIWGCDYFYKSLPTGGSFIAWDKRNENLDRVPGNPTEFCWAYPPVRRCTARVLWSGHHGMQSDDTKTRVHPTQKPTKLAEWFFEQWGAKAINIVDIYLGSGSTLIACEKTNRKCYGMEIDPHYCDVIISRWQNFTGKEATLVKS
jgi:DNA modification methylase